jgi:hypothetical protein
MARFKGYYGSLRSCFGGRKRWADSKCNKLSLKLKFNFRDPEQRFFGLKKVALRLGRIVALYYCSSTSHRNR